LLLLRLWVCIKFQLVILYGN
ncbi:na+/H+ antiporter, NhaD family protein, partial [Chlamydia psittaci C1/97]